MSGGDLALWKGDGLSYTPGDAFTTGTNGAGDDATTAVWANGGATATLEDSLIDPSRNPAIEFTFPVGSNLRARWETGAAARATGRVSFYFIDAPTTDNHSLIRVLQASNAQSFTVQTFAGDVRLYDASNTRRITSGTGIVVDGANVRIEVDVNTATDTATLRVYNGDAGTPTFEDTYVGSAGAFGSNVDEWWVGPHLNTAETINYQIDDVEVNSDGVWPGPVVADPPTAAATQENTAIIDATGSTPGGGGALSYGIVQDSGTATTPEEISPGRWAVERHAIDTLVYTVTVTEGSQNDTVQVSVEPPVENAVLVRNAANDGWG